MAEDGIADEIVPAESPRSANVAKKPKSAVDGIKKRWRAWLRAIHRDVGYLTVGFTFIYAISGIAQNHIEEWGDVSFSASERQITIPAVAEDVPDAVAIERVARAVGLGTPTDTFRAGDEIRLTYANGEKVTALGDTVTIQGRKQRFFIGVANWLHKARGKTAWKYISDVYAVLLIYLAISGLFMIKGRLGLKWRGTLLVLAGVAVPVIYVAASGGSRPPAPEPTLAESPSKAGGPAVLEPLPPEPDEGPAVLTPLPPEPDTGGAVLKPLPPEPD